MRYIGAIRFPIRVTWRFIRDYPESAHVTSVLLKAFGYTYGLWRRLSQLMGPDLDRNGQIVWQAARHEWVPRLERYAQLKIVVTGMENIDPETRYVIAANHASTLDIIALVKAVPDGVFVVKSNVVKSRYPVIARAVRKGGQIIVERGDSAQAVRAVNAGIRMRPQASPIFFVEGTRSADGRIAAFKKGAFRVAIDHGLPILPLVICGSHEALPRGTLMGLRRGSTIHVRCLEPIETTGMAVEDLPILMERTRRIMTDVYYGHPSIRPPEPRQEAVPWPC